MMGSKKNSFCSFCGNAFAPDAPFPRTCAGCSSVTYVNPLPVAVLVIPVDDAVLCIRREIEPHRGKLALPGGFINVGESWQDAAAREVMEETGVRVDASLVRDFRVLSAPDGTVLVFGIVPPRTHASLGEFVRNEETSEWVMVREPVELAFPLHTRVLREYFERRAAGHLPG